MVIPEVKAALDARPGYRRELPCTRAQHELLRSLDELTLAMAPDWF